MPRIKSLHQYPVVYFNLLQTIQDVGVLEVTLEAEDSKTALSTLRTEFYNFRTALRDAPLSHWEDLQNIANRVTVTQQPGKLIFSLKQPAAHTRLLQNALSSREAD